MSSRTSTLRLIRYITIAIIGLLIVIYAIFRSLNYIHGPVIEIFQPLDGSSIASTTTTIIGRADRITSLTMNDKTVFIDESGNFQETLIIFPGVNIITFTAHDQFGRIETKHLELVGTLNQ